MVRDELIINGEVVDIGDVDITLEYANNMMTPVDKITSSKSYTIKLPRTAKNERILDLPSSVAHVSAFVGKFFPASYRRNGITIIPEGQAYITGVDGTINVCLLWNNLAPFSKWVAEGKKIADLDLPVVTYGTATPWASRGQDVIQAYVDTGLRSATTDLPITQLVVCMSLWSLFTDIMNNELGVNWAMDNRYLNAMKSLFVPCLSFEGGWATESGAYGINEDLVARPTVPYIQFKNGRALRRWADNIFLTSIDASLKIDTDNFVFRLHDIIDGNLINNPLYLDLKCVAGEDSGTTLASYPMTVHANRESATLTIHDEVDLSKCDQLQFDIRGYSSTRTWLVGEGDIVVREKFATSGSIGSEYIVQNNIADVKQVDIIKAVCAIYGLSLISLPDGSLKYVPYSDVITNKNSAYDWTSRIVDFDKVPNKTQFKVGSFALKNNYKYAADEKNGTFNADGVLYSGSETNGQDSNIVTLAFAASDGDIIPFYEQKENGSLKQVKVKPRLMGIKQYESSGAKIQLTFSDDLWFDNILQTSYGVIQGILEYPVTITVYARLDEAILKNLRMDRAVYLGQTGHYYVIEKITTDNQSDICELELIQLN